MNSEPEGGLSRIAMERVKTAAESVGTPAYVYDLDIVRERFATLSRLFGRNFGVSFAVKSNPNIELLKSLKPLVTTLDVSSFGEVERGLKSGFDPRDLTFSGPAKRAAEIRGAIACGIGELVLESVAEARLASAFAQELGVTQDVLIRLNPMKVPRHFGVNMAGKPSQFGIDEEVCGEAIDTIRALPGLALIGFHIYSGTNSLNVDAIAENFDIFIDLFKRAAERADIFPRKLIFGSGFGIPYMPGESPLAVDVLAERIMPEVDALKSEPRFAHASCILEMGRWIVGPAGWLVTRVVAAKESRGVQIRACDAGFNNHLAACGMMGTVIRRNWRIRNLSNPLGDSQKYLLVGPLCTTIDILATNIELPEVRVDDLLAIESSGAYGITASPTRFISHPEPAEVLLDGDVRVDATESTLSQRAIAGLPRSAPAKRPPPTTGVFDS